MSAIPSPSTSISSCEKRKKPCNHKAANYTHRVSTERKRKRKRERERERQTKSKSQRARETGETQREREKGIKRQAQEDTRTTNLVTIQVQYM